MPFYVRAFCTGTKPPAINAVMQSLGKHGADFKAQVDDSSELDSASCGQ
jgi:hypothetical protein